MSLKKDFANLKVAIVADDMVVWGGAQYTVQVISEMFPQSTVFTSIAESEMLKKYFPQTKVVTSFVQKLPFEKKFRKEYLLFYPYAFKSFNFNGYDLVISVSSAFAKMIKVKKPMKHLFLCLTPPRFLWMNKESRSIKKSSKLSYLLYDKFFNRILHPYWKNLDLNAAKSADKVYANSKEVQKRIKEYYDIESGVLYPPVNLSNLPLNKNPESRKDWFLYFGRVETYKGIELVIKACVKAGQHLIVGGGGQDLEKMRELVKNLNASNLIKLLGFVPEDKKWSLLSNCKALVFPVRDEDFGIVPVEANATGTPVIAFKGGGALESLSDDNPKTAIFFDSYDENYLAEILSSFDSKQFKPENCRKQAELFDRKIFEYKLKCIIEEMVSPTSDSNLSDC